MQTTTTVRAHRRRFTQLAIALAALVTLVTTTAGPARAIDLEDVITGLYGGDGITLDTTVSAGHAAHFTTSGIDRLAELGGAIGQSLNSVSIGASVSSFVFDTEQAVFVRTNESLGPLIAERANTIGRGKISFGWNYTRLDFKHFGGDSLDGLRVIFAHEGTTFKDAIQVDLDVQLEQDVVQIFGSYGILDDWDVSLVLPLVRSEITATARGRVLRNDTSSFGNHVFCDDPASNPSASCNVASEDASNDRRSAEAFGVGDIRLLTKYHFLKATDVMPDLAIGGEVKVPSGKEEDFLGTGETHFSVIGIASKTIGRFSPHANVGVETATDTDFSQFRYIVGVDTALHERATLAVDLIGRSIFERSVTGPDQVDFGVGAKISPWKTLTFLANVIFPLNPDDGLRTDVTWTLGTEYTF